jgi:hypothetical protein
MKQTSTSVNINGGKINSGGKIASGQRNGANPLKIESNGRGVGELPGYNTPYMEQTSENVDPMKKHDMGGIVGA